MSELAKGTKSTLEQQIEDVELGLIKGYLYWREKQVDVIESSQLNVIFM